MTFSRRMPFRGAARSWQHRELFSAHAQLGTSIMIHRSASWSTAYAASRHDGIVTLESLSFVFVSMSVLDF